MQLDRPLAVMTPTMDGDVLGVLAQADANFTSGQIRRILENHSEQGIRNVLGRLSEQGIVIGERIGKAVAYRLNREHLAAPPLLELLKMRTALISKLETLCDEWLDPPRYGAVFGSAARGRMTAQSDIDILLVRHENASELIWDTQTLDIVLSVQRWTGNQASLLILSEAEVTERASEPALLDLRTYALTFAGDRAWFDRQFARRSVAR